MNWSDYGWRNYDFQLGRWHSVDPMTESQEAWTPYHYVYNNSVLRTDPDGRCPDGDCPEISVAGIIENTAKDLAVSAMNLAFMAESPLAVIEQGGHTRASRDEKGKIQVGTRPLPTSTRELAGNLVSDVLDGVNVASTVATGGTGGAGLLMAKTGGKVLLANGVVQTGKGIAADGQKLIGPAGDAGATVTKQIPDNWIKKPARKDGTGTRFIDPSNNGNHVRVMRGDPSAPHTNSKKPYVVRYINGSGVDKSKKVVPTPTGKKQNREADLHVPATEFKF